MFRKLLGMMGRGGVDPATGSYAPYANEALNKVYNLLFCDDLSAFKPEPGGTPAPWKATLFSEPMDAQAVLALAQDPAQEGRVRALAYKRLRDNGHPVPPKQLLGTIVEVRLNKGLDVLAAFSEGGVRFIHKAEHLAVYEGVESLQPLVSNLLKVSEAVAARLGPWDKPRLPPPRKGNVRFSLLLSDGLYFGEGQVSAMQQDTFGGPLFQRATELLQAVLSTPPR